MLDRSVVGQYFHPYPVKQSIERSVSPAGNRCYFVLLDKDESCPTADLGELLNTPGLVGNYHFISSQNYRTTDKDKG